MVINDRNKVNKNQEVKVRQFTKEELARLKKFKERSAKLFQKERVATSEEAASIAKEELSSLAETPDLNEFATLILVQENNFVWPRSFYEARSFTVIGVNGSRKRTFKEEFDAIGPGGPAPITQIFRVEDGYFAMTFFPAIKIENFKNMLMIKEA